MDIDFDVKTHRFLGQQTLTYYNNSPDTLLQVFYHLYFNAFQPGSMMDVRSRTIADPDPRVGNRIASLSPEEIGFQKVKSLTQDGQEVVFETVGTILEVKLAQPLLPGQKTVLAMQFEGQVPVQIRRSGRNSAEGIAYSMTQWYPKLCEYDYQGWHANPYIAREFHGVWGDFEVKIQIDPNYIVAGTGYLQNPNEVGYGYESPGTTVKKNKKSKLTWHFKAPQVHDFAWAADPDYVHDIVSVPDGPTLHFFYQNNPDYVKNWKDCQPTIVRAFQFMNQRFGKYPYASYAVIQGGDGGMEYPMCTLVTGNRSTNSLIGVVVHELIHSWYQGVLATNESLYAWMDEGFNSYAGNLFNGGDFPHEGSYNYYFNIVKRKIEEPLSTHADHFEYNSAYGMAAYAKGCVFLAQLGYVIGEEALARTMKRYYDTWKFRHPNDNDFIRIAEKESGLELDWYKEYFVYTTHTVDYALEKIEEVDGKTQITLKRLGRMPMPIELLLTPKEGPTTLYYIPLEMMRGQKPKEDANTAREVLADWPWTHPTYTFQVSIPLSKIKKVEIDPSLRMADTDRKNNEAVPK
ncbi:MAG: M1 family metallopeptidase [Microscillaceae bacterium]|nr:M1 family metallopeptidase [Microscillaceae bacterium]